MSTLNEMVHLGWEEVSLKREEQEERVLLEDLYRKSVPLMKQMKECSKSWDSPKKHYDDEEYLEAFYPVERSIAGWRKQVAREGLSKREEEFLLGLQRRWRGWELEERPWGENPERLFSFWLLSLVELLSLVKGEGRMKPLLPFHNLLFYEPFWEAALFPSVLLKDSRWKELLERIESSVTRQEGAKILLLHRKVDETALFDLFWREAEGEGRTRLSQLERWTILLHQERWEAAERLLTEEEDGLFQKRPLEAWKLKRRFFPNRPLKEASLLRIHESLEGKGREGPDGETLTALWREGELLGFPEGLLGKMATMTLDHPDGSTGWKREKRLLREYFADPSKCAEEMVYSEFAGALLEHSFRASEGRAFGEVAEPPRDVIVKMGRNKGVVLKERVGPWPSLTALSFFGGKYLLGRTREDQAVLTTFTPSTGRQEEVAVARGKVFRSLVAIDSNRCILSFTQDPCLYLFDASSQRLLPFCKENLKGVVGLAVHARSLYALDYFDHSLVRINREGEVIGRASLSKVAPFPLSFALNSNGAAVVLGLNRYFYEKSRERLDGLGSSFSPEAVGRWVLGVWQEGEFVQKQELSPGVRDYFEGLAGALPSTFVRGDSFYVMAGARLGRFRSTGDGLEAFYSLENVSQSLGRDRSQPLVAPAEEEILVYERETGYILRIGERP